LLRQAANWAQRKDIELAGEIQVKALVLILLNLVLVSLFLFLFTRRRLLTYYQNRRLWLTWLSVAIITLMDTWYRRNPQKIMDS
jgi:hypothetical protein